MFVSNQKGMGLVEVMVALAVMALLSLGFAQMMINQARNVTYLEARMERTQLEAELRHEFETSGHCETSFAGAVIDASPLDVVVKNIDGTTKINPITPPLNKYGNIKVSRAQLHNVDTGGPNSDGYFDLVVESEDVNGRTLRPASVRLHANLGASGEILSCAPDTDSGCFDIVNHLDGASYLAASGSISVPSDAKAIEFRLNQRSQGPDCLVGVNGGTEVIHLGLTKVGAKVLEAGKTLSFAATGLGNTVVWRYDGVDIARVSGVCSAPATETTWEVYFPRYGTLGNKTCPSMTLPFPSPNHAGRAIVWK